MAESFTAFGDPTTAFGLTAEVVATAKDDIQAAARSVAAGPWHTGIATVAREAS
jgi:hypothetical protein